MLNTVIISAVYPPEPLVSARMSQDLACYLSRLDSRVTVLCPQPSRPASANLSYHGNRSGLILEQKDGVEVFRLSSFTAPQSLLLDRARESFSFGQRACVFMRRNLREKPGVLYVNAWPMLSQALIAHYAQRNNIPMVLQLMDIYPESMIPKLPGPIKRLTALPLIQIDRWIAYQAAFIVVISQNMKRTYVNNRRINEKKVVIINTWQDEAMFEDLPSRQAGCEYYGIREDMFTFLYLGNIGPVAGVEFLIRAFYKAAIGDSQLIVVGDGSEKSKCVDLANHFHAANIHFIADPAAKNVPLLQSMADVCLLPLKSGAGMSSIPSKLIAYMFSAKPVLAAVDDASDTARTISRAECGWVEQPENVGLMVSRMRQVSTMSLEELEPLGQSGRRYGLDHFSKGKGVQRLANLVLEAATPSQGQRRRS